MSPLRALAAAFVAAGTVLTVSPADAGVAPVSASMMTISNGVYFDDCVGVPYSLDALNDWAQQAALDWGNMWGTYNYSLTLNVIHPDGSEDIVPKTILRSDDTTSSAFDTDVDHSLFECSTPGAYVIQASGWWCPVNETPEDSPADCQSIAFTKRFTMRAARSAITLSAPRKARAKAKYSATASVKVERSTGFYPRDAVDVTLQYRKGARWVTMASAYTSSKGAARLKSRFAKPGRYQVRAVVRTIDSDNYASSASAVTTVRVKH